MLPAEDAVQLAESLLIEANAQLDEAESCRMERVANLIGHPRSKALSMVMTDRLFRSNLASRSAGGWRNILCRIGVGRGFAFFDRVLLRLGAFGSRFFPSLTMRAVKDRLRKESSDVILSAGEPRISEYLGIRHAAGTQVNLNQLGEAVLGEEQAGQRLDSVMALLGRADVNYVSVKVSAIFSQINLVAWEATVESIKARLRSLYRAAIPKGKFVNLDMEEYRDLHLTVTAFREVLSEPEFLPLSAGLALQAYLPDSIEVQRELTRWARERCEAGGASIKIRIVKGANLAMESVEAEWHGWNQAPHSTKLESDAGFKRMIEFACQPENAKAVRIGVGSHNLFDIALALVLRRRHEVEQFVEIEMLEGMAPAQARAVAANAGEVLMYAPVVKDEDFGSALAYLIRRLDENTSPGNYLADIFSLKPGTSSWEAQKGNFLDAWRLRDELSCAPKRSTVPRRDESGFTNEPDTDWTQADNRIAVLEAIASTEGVPSSGADEIEAALKNARKGQPRWESLGEAERRQLLRSCGEQIALTRFESIAILRDEGKKAIVEADVEVSEAVDFAGYYAETGVTFAGVESKALGVVVVAPPWNFPFAIPCGGILAALMAGNAVIFKPAPESVRIGWWLVNQLWKAGVPRDALQFVACADGEIGRSLIEDDRTDAVILTGAFETARRFQMWRPGLKLFAETSGKNAMVVSALADRELAVRDLVRSAFGHAGQKCSAASLGILEAEVYDDPVFRRQLRDAAASLSVGPASDLRSVVTPLVQKPTGNLLRALTTLEEGEEWLLEPEVSSKDPCLWSPGIRIGVKPGSWFHLTECFGPVLGIMHASDLNQAVDLQNAVSYGLTAGFQSLDESEIEWWKERAEAGNLYVNRGITGAIVQRQPFGGWKQSCIGPGAKAGGPNYVNLFRHYVDLEPVEIDSAAAHYREAWETHFGRSHDPAGLRCESNVFRYRPSRGVLLRLPETDHRTEELAKLASEVSGSSLWISRASEESDEEFARRIEESGSSVEFLRTIDGPPGKIVLEAAYKANLNWIDAPMSVVGRLELPRWTREQSVTETRHRYGNVFYGE